MSARTTFARSLALFALLCLALRLTGCKEFTAKDADTAKDVTKGALSTAQKACVFLNAFLPRTKLAQWCNISEPLLRALDELLPAALAARQASSPGREMAGAAPPKLYTCEDVSGAVTCHEASP